MLFRESIERNPLSDITNISFHVSHRMTNPPRAHRQKNTQSSAPPSMLQLHQSLALSRRQINKTPASTIVRSPAQVRFVASVAPSPVVDTDATPTAPTRRRSSGHLAQLPCTGPRAPNDQFGQVGRAALPAGDPAEAARRLGSGEVVLERTPVNTTGPREVPW